MKRFITFRIKIYCQKERLKLSIYNSLTMARHFRKIKVFLNESFISSLFRIIISVPKV